MGEANRRRDLGHTPPKDTRVVYGMHCSWWGSISEISIRDGLPCCPHCGSPLFETESPEKWWELVDNYEKAGHPGYRKLVEWSAGKHFFGWIGVRDGYLNATGIYVSLERVH